MFCSECGAKNPDDAAFCSECGKKLEKPQESASINENSVPQNTQYQKVEEVQNVQNEQNAHVQNNQDKKSPLLKVVIIIVLLAILGGAIYFAYTKYFKGGNNSFLSGTTTKTEWGDKYLVYLNSAKAQTDKKARANEYGIPENAEELKIRFVEVPGLTDPIMVLNYTLDGKEYALIYYINKEGKVSLVTYNEETNVEYLYNIEAKTYSWYVHSTNAGTHKYTLLEKAITDLSVLNQDTNTQNVDATNTTTPPTTAEVTVDYTFTESEMSTKYNDTFIKPEIENSKGTDIDLDSEDDLKNTVDSAIDDYKPTDELLKEEDKKEVEEKAKEIEDAVLSNEEALKIGLDLYAYGDSLQDYDYETRENYLGKSRTPAELLELDTIGISGFGYKFGNPADVEDYFTQKRINEIGENGDPYGLAKRGNDWYYVSASVGSTFSYVGYVVELKEVTKDKITFIAKTYYVKDENFSQYMDDSSIPYPNWNDMDDKSAEEKAKIKEEYVKNVSSKYQCDIFENNFVIVLEDGKWKIDEQTILY